MWFGESSSGEEWLYLYLLIEFQSKVDQHMALRMMVYVGLLYQDLIKNKQIGAANKLPPVLPIVLYNGQPRWNAKTDIADLIPTLPEFLRQYTPHMKYLVIDEGCYSDEELASKKNLVAAIFRLEQTVTPETIEALLQSLCDWLKDDSRLSRMFAVWIRAILKRNSEYRIMLPKIDDLQELRIMLSDRVEQWAKDYEAKGILKGRMEGREEGIEKGIEKGRCAEASATLLRFLTRKFGAVPHTIRTRIEQADLESLELWLDRILDAKSMDEVFDFSDIKH